MRTMIHPLITILTMLGALSLQTHGATEYPRIQWTDLIPHADLEALKNPPPELANIADGSEQDQLPSQRKSDTPGAKNNEYNRALASTRVKTEFHNRHVKIPGFIVPLEFGDDQTIITFFLVPYFGACIHMPPPPPNQIIYASYPQGIKLEHLYEPFLVQGKLTTEIQGTELGTAAYSIEVNKILPFNE